MSDPRFQPRLMAVPSDRGRFGRVAQIAWLEGSTESEVKRIATARLQHALVVKIMAKLQDKGQNIRSYADLAGVSYDRMGKVLRGEALMRLEDVADAERLLGVSTHELLDSRGLPIPEPVGVEPLIDTILRHRALSEQLREYLAAEYKAAKDWRTEFDAKLHAMQSEPLPLPKPDTAEEPFITGRDPEA